VFFDSQVGCAKCHSVGGQGAQIGPDLSNVVHRDYHSVLRDIRDPGFAINPEFISQAVVLTDGRTISGVVRKDGERLLVGNDRGEVSAVAIADIETLHPLTVSAMPKGQPETLGPDRLRDLLTFLLTPAPRMPDYGASAPPPPRTRGELAALLAGAPEPPAAVRALKIVLVAGPKDHGPGEHDYPAWQAGWSELLACANGVEIETAERWPSHEQLARADVLVFYQQGEWNPDRARDLAAFQSRGGGAVFLHYAVDGGRDPTGFAERIGLAWQGGRSKFRHGPLELHFAQGSLHPIARNFARVSFVDESYWSLVGDSNRMRLLASGIEENSPQPLFWTVEHPAADSSVRPGRVVVSILGHFSWTFDDPLFRLLVLRGIAWAGHDSVDRFNEIVALGTRIE
jgi:putative heme-binding domain-containing protein